MTDLAATLKEALAQHQRGRLDDAAELYGVVLAQMPQHADALHMLGVVRRQQGRHDEASALIGQAIALAPSAAAYSNLGLALHDAGRHHDALASFDRSLALRPDAPHVLANRGHTLRALRRDDEALASYERAIALAPDNADAHYHRANALLALARHAEAAAGYERALALAPDLAAASNNRGIALLGLGRHADALASFDAALRVAPRNAEVLNNRGNALQALRRMDDALASYDLALACKAGYADPLVNRGNVLRGENRHAEALASYERALAIAPDHVEGLVCRGHALRAAGRADEAVQCFARVARLAPDYPYLAGHLLYARMACCDWTDYQASVDAIGRDARAGRKSAEPFGHIACATSSRDMLEGARTYAADLYPAAAVPLWRRERHADRRIRLGYLCGEFRQQATSILMAELFERHDRERFELYAFDSGWDDGSALRARIVQAFDRFVPIDRNSDVEAATMIRDLGIGILVNLNGYFGRARQGVFALRPAPIQVNYLGFPGTIGADYIDYLIADRHVIPPGEDDCYVERIVRLPDCYQVNDARRAIAAEAGTRAEAGLPDAGFVFCSFNNNYKITPDVFAVWMRLLASVEGSVLWLLHDNAVATANLQRAASARGVAPERLVFAPRVDLDRHLARHRHAGLFLDTLPCNAHTTASDALWAGLPLLTCAGTTFPGRVAASLLHAIGLPDLVTRNLGEYEALARALAGSPERLAALRATLARHRGTHPLFDTDRFRHHIEAAYATMHERDRRGLPPAAFDVAAQGAPYL
jgi:predicted O-linked N-acetylglucosamine transferase (SPINDLY family)